VADRDVRKRAKIFIQGVQAQLRIWDTFGDHEKNRRFAYQNAHVVILCFSIGMPSSLRNVNAKWYPEIKKYAPRASIILVGTQLDRRHTDPCVFKCLTNFTTLTDILKNDLHDLKGKSKRQTVQQCIQPEFGRQTAREIGAANYMETSVVTKHGVNDVFENAIRVALIARRHAKPSVFTSNLKRIKEPVPQKPYLPPLPDAPSIKVPPTCFNTEFSIGDSLSDITFLVDHELISAHCVILISGSYVFSRLLTHPSVFKILGYENFIPEVEEKNIKTKSGYINGVLQDGIPIGFETIDVLSDPTENSKVFIKLKDISATDFRSALEFIYTGKIKQIQDPLRLLSVANYLSLPLLAEYVKNILNGENFMNFEVQKQLKQRKVRRYVNYFFKKEYFADICFLVEDSVIPSHKCLLISQCSMMKGMFRKGTFKESITQNVDFQDTTLESFLALLEYLYTGSCKYYGDLHGTLQLANFLCLPRLIALCEEEIVKYIKDMYDNGNNQVYSAALASYHLAQFHNAPQLSAWCIHFMAINYNALCREQGKEMKVLEDSTLKYLEDNRWPPVWYLKEQDHYERAMQQLEKERNLKKKKKRRRKIKASCFH